MECCINEPPDAPRMMQERKEGQREVTPNVSPSLPELLLWRPALQKSSLCLLHAERGQHLSSLQTGLFHTGPSYWFKGLKTSQCCCLWRDSSHLFHQCVWLSFALFSLVWYQMLVFTFPMSRICEITTRLEAVCNLPEKERLKETYWVQLINIQY